MIAHFETDILNIANRVSNEVMMSVRANFIA